MNESAAKPWVWFAVAAALLLVVLLGGQGLAAATVPAGGIASTGRVLGQTSYAYLGGLRTFAAAVLWNRLDPIFDSYYGSTRHVKDLVEFLPTMRLVQILDPQFEQAYYNSVYILARRDKWDEALAIADEGIRNNPKSGLLRANKAQILMLQDKKANLPTMLELARRGVQPDIRWANSDDQFEGYGIFRAVFRIAGDQAMVDALNRAQDSLRQQDSAASPGDAAPQSGGD